MDPKLYEAAINGDVEFLLKAIEEEQRPHDYFLQQWYREGNLFHVATWRNQEEFVKVAIQKLPTELALKLLSQPDPDGDNPLHFAARKSLENVKVILGFYKSLPSPANMNSDNLTKPWLSRNRDKSTPLMVALDCNNVEIALEILWMDAELLCGMDDEVGYSPLFLAVLNGCSRVIEEILKCHPSSISVTGVHGSTPLHVLPYSCSETELKLLLNKYPDHIEKVDDYGWSVLHRWAMIGKTWPCKGYKQVATAKTTSQPHSIDYPPWKFQDKDGNTPLHNALRSEKRQLAIEFLSIDPTLFRIHFNDGESPFLLAVKLGIEPVMEEILRSNYLRLDILRSLNGTTVLHLLPSTPEKIGKRMVEKYWWMMNLKDGKNKTALDKAKGANADWLVKMLTNFSSIKRESFDWIEALNNKDTPAVLAFLDVCPDFPTLCRQQNDTPLHHIKLKTYRDYLNFLQIPSIRELKNTTDRHGATPLHRALERKDMLLAKVLLIDDQVEQDIADNKGTTALDLLATLCTENEEWRIGPSCTICLPSSSLRLPNKTAQIHYNCLKRVSH